MAAVVTMKQLLEAGVHFGHQTRRWNPKMKRFIYGDRGGIYIIDLQQTLKRIEVAYTFIRDLVAGGGTVLFVGTKKQAQDGVQSYAEKCGMPYVNQRWLGGMLTNHQTMAKRVAKMADYQRMRDSGEFEAMPKKEALLISRELVKLERNLGGIRKMERLPDAVFILDTKMEHIAVTEANKLGLPIVAVVDTNCDPDIISYVIPGNDDAIRSGNLMCRIVADAVDEGRFIASRRAGDGAGPAERSQEDEQRVASEQAEARRQASLAAQQREARLASGGPDSPPIPPPPIPPPPPAPAPPSPVSEPAEPERSSEPDDARIGEAGAAERSEAAQKQPSEAAEPERSSGPDETRIGEAGAAERSEAAQNVEAEPGTTDALQGEPSEAAEPERSSGTGETRIGEAGAAERSEAAQDE
ncbi:hypothetical protein BH20ACT2_BH20ACT2_16400 [soil metagenome]